MTPNHARTPASDTALVRAHIAGDPSALETLLEQWRPRIVSFATYQLRNEAAAQDIAQETLLRVWRHIGSFDPGNVFAAWILRIAANLVKDSRKGGWRKTIMCDADRPAPADEDEDLPPLDAVDPRIDIAGDIEREEELAKVEQAIATLPPALREVFELRELDEWTYEEIAFFTGATVGALKMRSFRARTLLQSAVSKPESGQVYR